MGIICHRGQRIPKKHRHREFKPSTAPRNREFPEMSRADSLDRSQESLPIGMFPVLLKKESSGTRGRALALQFYEDIWERRRNSKKTAPEIFFCLKYNQLIPGWGGWGVCAWPGFSLEDPCGFFPAQDIP